MSQKVQNVKMVSVCVCVYLYMCVCGMPNVKLVFLAYMSNETKSAKCEFFKKFFKNIIDRCIISFLYVAPV